MPVPITETPYGQYLLDLGAKQGRAIGEQHGRAIGEQHGRAIGEQHGRAIGEQHGRRAEAMRFHAVILRRRFPEHADHPDVAALAERLADLPSEAAADALFEFSWEQLAHLLTGPH